MNVKLVLRIQGVLLCSEAIAMLPSLGFALYDNSYDLTAFASCILITAFLGIVLVMMKPSTMQVGYKEGFIIATLGWISLAAFGGLPFWLSGAVNHLADAFFETMSGFTTTGASIFSNVEKLPRSILFWRSFTHWLGGMGIIVLTLALIPSLNIAGFQMYKAEVPGPTKSKVLPRVAQTSRQLYKIYLGITVIQIILLKLAGMNWFDSMIHTFATVATGGFSSKNASIGAYGDPIVELIIVFFMIACGINFSLYYSAIKGKPLVLFKNPEVLTYLGVIAVSVLLISINLMNFLHYDLIHAMRYALFQVASIITTTGFATTDFNQWPDFSRYILLILMFFGACAGSTGGGIKVIRVVILFKTGARQLLKLVHPQAVIPVRVGNEVVHQEVVQMVSTFFMLYLFIFAIVTGILTAFGIDIITAASAAASSLGNIGPGFGQVGPMSNYGWMPDTVKWILSFCMLVGRLEIYTVLVVFSRRCWR